MGPFGGASAVAPSVLERFGGNQPTVHQTIEQPLPAPRRIPPLGADTHPIPHLDYDKSRLVSRSILTQSVCPEQICFPLVGQAARLLRQSDGRQDDHITLLTIAEPEKLDAQRWLEFNRAGFGGIENALHQRLDISHNDDRCRIRLSPSMFVVGLFLRISNNIFLEWRSPQPHPENLTTTDFYSAMGEEHCRPAMRLVCARNPSLKPP